MNHTSTADLAYRPATYWIRSAEQYIAHRPKGTVRRRLLQEPLLEEAIAWLSKESLTEEERREWGKIHPDFLGGEFLPDLEENEVEIARIVMNSVTGDVISVRARRDAGGVIRYSVADEYPEYEMEYCFSPTSSAAPLTFGEMVTFLDTLAYRSDRASGGVIWEILRSNAENGDNGWAGVKDFLHVSSEFYPGLTAFFDQKIRQRITDTLRAQRAEKSRGRKLLKQFEPEIQAVIAREDEAGRFSGRSGGMARHRIRQEIERAILATGQLPPKYR